MVKVAQSQYTDCSKHHGKIILHNFISTSINAHIYSVQNILNRPNKSIV